MSGRLQIIEYFDALINEIDLKAETLLIQIPKEYHEYIDDKRQSFIREVDQIKQFNLLNLNEVDELLNQQSLFKKYCFLLDMEKMTGHRFISYDKERYYEKRLKNLKVNHFFTEIIDKSFGVLIILLDGYLSDEKVSLFKELLHFHECYFQYEDDKRDDEFKQKANYFGISSKLKEQIKYFPFENDQNSRIFKSDFYQSSQLYWTIWLQYDVFKKPNDFMIKTDKHGLFKLNYLYFHDVTVDSISDAALELLGGDISLFVYMKLFDIHILNKFIKFLQTHVKIKKVHLSIDDNVDVEMSMFDEISNLHELIIKSKHGLIFLNSYDLLTENSVALSSSITSLKKLKIDSKNSYKNYHRHINGVLLRNLINLEQLSVSWYTIKNLKLDTFCGLANLRDLKLASNGIVSIESRTFSCLINLNLLDLSRNKIKNIQSDAFNALDNLKHLYLSSNELESTFFLSYLKNLTDLQLAVNQLTKLPANSFEGCPNLETLNLSDNFLVTIDEEAFNHLSQLKTLKLSGNQAISVSVHTFDKLVHLEQLVLSKCYCKNLKDLHLNGLIKLKTINLCHNRIDSLASDSFAGLLNLHSIDLSYNRIRHVDPQVFDQPLAKLQLIGNDIIDFEQGMFSNLTNLSELTLSCKNFDWFMLLENMKSLVDLNLSCSNIKHIRSEVNFQQLVNLKCLIMDKNQIKVLTAGIFSTLSNLERLSISQNNIQLVDESTFEGLKNLRYLDLSTNEIEFLSAGTFNGLQNLENLSLAMNQIETLEFLNTDCLTNLKCLNLSQNRIEKIDSSSFSCLFALLSLNLQNNRIKQIDTNSFRNFNFLREINLLKNPIGSIVSFETFAQVKHLKYLQLDVISQELNANMFKNLQYLNILVNYELNLFE